jgi:hypothetical protein
LSSQVHIPYSFGQVACPNILKCPLKMIVKPLGVT